MIITTRTQAWLRRRGYSERLKTSLAQGLRGKRRYSAADRPRIEDNPLAPSAPIIVLEHYRRRRAEAL